MVDNGWFAMVHISQSVRGPWPMVRMCGHVHGKLIHGAAIYGAPYGSHQYTPVMLAFFSQHQPDPSW